MRTRENAMFLFTPGLTLRLLFFLAAVAVAALAARPAKAITIFADDEAGWLAALSGTPEVFAFTASNVALANEAGAIANGTLLGPILSFETASTGLSSAFAFVDDAPEVGSEIGKEIIFVGAPNGPALGTITPNGQEHDWRIDILPSGAPVFAIGLSITSPAGAGGHQFIVNGDTGSPVINVVSDFLGIVSDQPILSLLYDDTNDAGGRGATAIRFGQVAVSEPSAFALAALAASMVLLARSRTRPGPFRSPPRA